MPIDFNYTGTIQSVEITEVDGLQPALDLKSNLASPTFTGNVGGITKAMVGLADVDDTSDANKPVSTAQQSALDLKANQTSISNIDNTSDLLKPVSTATTTQLNLKQPLLNTSDLFLDTSVAGQPKLGLGTATPTSASGGDTLLQLFGQTDVALSIKRGGGGDWEFKCNNPTGSLSVYNAGSHRAEWTNTEFELKQGLTVKGAVVDLEALPTVAQTGTTKLWNNSGSIDIGAGASGGGGGSGVILEKFCNYTQGQVWATSAGNVTLDNVTAKQTIALIVSNSNLLGSNISYQPPAGTTRVEYEYSFYAKADSSFSNAVGMKFLIDNVVQTITYAKQNLLSGGTSSWGQARIHYKVIIFIDGASDDASKCSVASWSSAKLLKVEGTAYQSGSNTISLHESTSVLQNPENPSILGTAFCPPMLTITAY